MSYTLQQLQQMGATPTPKKSYTLDELQKLGATPSQQVTTPEPQSVKTSGAFGGQIPVKDNFLTKTGPSFPAVEGGASTIVPNIARTFGNIPSSVRDLTRGVVGVVPEIAKNIGESGKAVQDIVKNVGPLEGAKTIYNTYADTVNKAVGGALSSVGSRASSGYVSPGSNFDGQGPQLLSNIVKKGIEDPALIPSLLYTPGEVGGESLISKVASPITRGADTRLVNLPRLVAGQVLPEAKAINQLEQTYTELLTGTKSKNKAFSKAQAVTEAKNLAGTTGRTPQRYLAESGIVPAQSGAKLTTLQQSEDLLKSTQYLRDTNRQALSEVERQVPKVNLASEEQKAIARAKTSSNINSGKAEGLVREIRREYQALRRAYGESVPITTLDDIKSARWGRAPFDTTRPLLSDANYLIAKTAQQTIEDTALKAGFKDVAQLNREVGDALEASKFLKSLDGQTVKGGRLQRYVFQAIGSTTGNTVLGKILGALGGDAVANVLISNSVAGPVKRMILNRIQRKSPAVYEQAVKFLNEQDLLRQTRPLLPAGAPKGSANNPIQLPAPVRPDTIKSVEAARTFGQDPKTGKFFRAYTSGERQSFQPKSALPKDVATTIASRVPNTNEIIPKTLPQAVEKSSVLPKANIVSYAEPKVVEAFNKSTGQVSVGPFELGSFGKSTTARKLSQPDRFPISELQKTIDNIKTAYRADGNELVYRYDNVAWIAKMPNGETRVIYTRINPQGKEEILNWHSLDKTKEAGYIEKLKSFGAPAENRTRILSLERNGSNPLTYGSK